MIGREFALC